MKKNITGKVLDFWRVFVGVVFENEKREKKGEEREKSREIKEKRKA